MITVIQFNTNLPILAVSVIVPVLDPAMVNRHKVVTTQLVAMDMREGNIALHYIVENDHCVCGGGGGVQRST